MMAAAQRGDRVQYRALLKEAANWLTAFFARRIAPAMVDDLVQETLMSLHDKRASFDPERAFLPWLAAIARYRWIDALRRLAKAPRALDDVDEPGVASGEEASIARFSLEKLLGQIPASQANCILLAKVEGRSIAEISNLTGQSEALVKVNIHRGMKKMAALVESE